jgi:hypothetical protein
MENRAPYAPALKAPRNLAAPLAEWLRTQGFTATEQHHDTLATVAAHWLGPVGECYDFTYTWAAGPVPEATCQLRVSWLGLSMSLFTAQRARRLRDVRLLLLGNVRYANARTLTTLTHPAP